MGGRHAARLVKAIELVDDANGQDPRGRELVYGQRMSARLAAHQPGASAALQVACRAQHIRRWEIPRDRYPEGRTGYKQWRAELARRHGDYAAAIAVEAGFDRTFAERVSELVRKLGLATDPEVQVLEDVACLVFLEHYLGDFAARHPRDKVVDVIAKTARKMSARGLEAVGQLELSPALVRLIGEAKMR